MKRLPSSMRDVASARKSGELTKPTEPKRHAAFIWARNVGAQDLDAGAPVAIVALRPWGYAQGLKSLKTGDFSVDVARASADVITATITLDAIPRGKYGRLADNPVFAHCFNPVVGGVVNGALIGMTAPPRWIVAARGELHEGAAVCALYPFARLTKNLVQYFPAVENGTLRGSDLPDGELANIGVVRAGSGLRFTYEADVEDPTGFRNAKVVGLRADLSAALTKDDFVQSIRTASATRATGLTTGTDSFVKSVDFSDTAVGSVSATKTNVVGVVAASRISAITSMAPETTSVVKSVAPQVKTYSEIIDDTKKAVIWDLATDDDDFVQSIATTTTPIVKTATPTTKYVTGSVTPTTGTALASVEATTGSFLTSATAQTGSGVASIASTSGTFATSGTSTEITFVDSVSLVDSSAAAGGRQIVTGISCVNGQLQVATAYVALQVHTTTMNVLTGLVTGTAVATIAPTAGTFVTGITTTSDDAVTEVEGEEATFVKTITAPRSSVVGSIAVETGDAIATLTPTTASALTEITPSTVEVLQEFDFKQQTGQHARGIVADFTTTTETVVKSTHEATGMVVQSIETTAANVVSEVAATTKELSATTTTGDALTSASLQFGGHCVTIVTPTTGRAVTDVSLGGAE